MRAHLIGGGIASLAAAVSLIKEGGLLGSNITIYEAGEAFGGALDAEGDASGGYFMRGGRMFEEKYLCLYELLSFIPSASDPARSISEDIADFYETSGWYDKARLVGNRGIVIDATRFGLNTRHRLDLAAMAAMPEAHLAMKAIGDCFEASFFKTNFWFMFATIFAFTSAHSAMEMRRYMHRFFHLLPSMADMSLVQRTRYNQYEAIVKPICDWLSRLGVSMLPGSKVIDIELSFTPGKITATSIQVEQRSRTFDVKVAPGDLVFLTNGSMVADSCRGSMTQAPELIMSKRDGSFALWEKLARGRHDFGRPEVFTADVGRSAWESFTIAAREPLLFEKIESLSGRSAGRGGLMTLVNSNWLVTLALLHPPHFIGQPESISLAWGFGLFPETAGNFVRKPMRMCTGAEVLEEVLRHLGFDDDRKRILAAATCVPCLMPYAGSVFMPRKAGDRPQVVPEGSTNFAFIGQFCELPDDVVFTTEYSVRSARVAVSTLLGLSQPPPVYKGERDLKVIRESISALFS